MGIIDIFDFFLVIIFYYNNKQFVILIRPNLSRAHFFHLTAYII